MKKKHNSRARFTAIKKLKRAYQYSEKLLKICESQTDKITALEARAYSFFLFGLFMF